MKSTEDGYTSGPGLNILTELLQQIQIQILSKKDREREAAQKELKRKVTLLERRVNLLSDGYQEVTGISGKPWEVNTNIERVSTGFVDKTEKKVIHTGDIVKFKPSRTGAFKDIGRGVVVGVTPQKIKIGVHGISRFSYRDNDTLKVVGTVIRNDSDN